MKTKVKIVLRHKTQMSWLAWLLVMFPFCFGTLNDFLGLPWVVRYLMDAVWLLLICFLLRSNPLKKESHIRSLAGWVGLFLLITALVYLVQYQSVLYYLWGVRNNFRFYAAFFAISAFMTYEDIDGCFKLFDVLFWINVVVSLTQYAFFELEGDFLGGIFGVEKGCNGYTNVFLVIIAAKSLIFYLEKRESAWISALKCVSALLIAALAELKFFFAEFVLILVMVILISNFTWRKFWVIIGGFSAVFVGVAIMVTLFPSFANFFSVEWFLENALSNKGYTSSGDLNRLNAIPVINEIWLENWAERLFGLGLGNCDTSTYDVLNTPFFQSYGVYHYSWISYAFLYLENGYLGLVLYFGFFVLVYQRTRRIEIRGEGLMKTYCRLARIMAVCCMIISVYNSSLRSEAAYMAYFVLAIPFACERERKTKRVPRGIGGA